MSIDRAKAMQSAQKYLAKGQLDKAIAEYERLVKDDPKDGRLLLKLGDLYSRQGDNKEACVAYRKVAEQYAEQGFFLKAVAVCKQILKLDPAQLDTWERLAEMYEMLSLGNDAVATYEQVADAHSRAGNHRKALRALEKVAELDPENVAARIRLAEALSKLNKPDEAALAFAQGAEVLKRQGRIDDYLKVGERLLYHQPDNYEFARELAAAYLDRGEAKHSLAKLQACFNADPHDLDTLQLLARAFEQLGQVQKTVSVLKELARLHASENRSAAQGSVLKRILALDPADTEAQRELAQLGQAPRGDVSQAAIEVDDDEADYDELVVEEDDELLQTNTGSGLRDLAQAEEEQKQERVTRLLNECGVFLRYGLNDKMIKQLHEVLTLDPQHVEARLKLKDAYLRVKQPAEAAKQLLTLSELVEKTDPPLALSCAREAQKLEPKNSRAAERVLLLEASGTEGAEGGTSDDEVIFVDDEERAASVAPVAAASAGKATAGRKAPKPEESFASVIPEPYTEELSPLPPSQSDESEDDEDLIVLEDDDEVLESVRAPAASQAPGPTARASVAARAQAASPPPPIAASLPPLAIRAPFAPPPAAGVSTSLKADGNTNGAAKHAKPIVSFAPSPSDDVPEEIGEAIDEVDFYLKQGLFDEAQDTLQDALERFPEHPVLLAKRDAVDRGELPPRSLPPAARSLAPAALPSIAPPSAMGAARSILPGPSSPVGPSLQPPAASMAPAPAASLRSTPFKAPTAGAPFNAPAAVAPSFAPPGVSIMPGSIAPGSIPPGGSSPDLSFELAQKLAEEVSTPTAAGSGPIDVADVLAAFKKGVAKQIDPGDAATHYDLGIAYMEMGLHGEAIEEFKLCLDEPARRCTAHTMIGLSFVAKGDMEPGIEHFKQALGCVPNADEELSLWFEMGNAHELLGKNMEALVWYEKVEERNPTFRDVALRLERLGTARTPQQEADEFDEMFDNMILKD